MPTSRLYFQYLKDIIYSVLGRLVGEYLIVLFKDKFFDLVFGLYPEKNFM